MSAYAPLPVRSTLLIRHAAVLVSMDDAMRQWEDGGIYVEDNVIARIGPTSELPDHADQVIDARNLIIVPGLVNTHHHFFQTLTRCIPGAQDATFMPWVKRLLPIWAGVTPEALRVSTATTIAELLLSGCTTAFDHNYLWVNGSQIEDQLGVAAEMGMRFHLGRGMATIGEAQGGFVPDVVVEDETAVLADARRAIEQYHDHGRYAMTRVVLAPGSPFSVSLDLMRESLGLARSYGVHVHTHLAEAWDEEALCLDLFGQRPVELADRLGWLGPDVWFAHMVHPSPEDVARLGQSRTGMAHCPNSNMRVASGIAPLPALMQAGVRVGLGADGAAANDSSHLLAEARQALLLQRVMGRADALTARQALHLATRGGAEVLGRDDIGHLAPGMAADFVGFRLDTLAFAGGAVHDPLAALILCQPPSADLNVINGRVRVRDGLIMGLDLEQLIERHNHLSRDLVRGWL